MFRSDALFTCSRCYHEYPFDSEKDIYTAIFKDLTEAIEILTEKAENGVEVMSEYDVVYAGNSTKWVKYANSLLLRLAMRVRYADEALSKQYVSQALNHSIGVMTAKDDEAQMSTEPDTHSETTSIGCLNNMMISHGFVYVLLLNGI